MIVENQISLSKRENKSLKYARSYFSSVKGTIGFSLLLIFVFMAIFAPGGGGGPNISSEPTTWEEIFTAGSSSARGSRFQ